MQASCSLCVRGRWLRRLMLSVSCGPQMRTTVILLGCVGLAAALAWALLASPSPQKMCVSVHCLARTNGVSVFQLSNASPFAVVVGQTAFIEFDSPAISPEPMVGRFSTLASGACEENEVEELATTNRVRWRLMVGCAPTEGELRSRVREALPRLLSPGRLGMVHFMSEWMEP